MFGIHGKFPKAKLDSPSNQRENWTTDRVWKVLDFYFIVLTDSDFSKCPWILQTGGNKKLFFSLSWNFRLFWKIDLLFLWPVLRLLDEDSLLGLLQGRASRMERQASSLRQEDAALQQESLMNGDMVFVDVVDTYRNVPSKLLQFYKWYTER